LDFSPQCQASHTISKCQVWKTNYVYTVHHFSFLRPDFFITVFPSFSALLQFSLFIIHFKHPNVSLSVRLQRYLCRPCPCWALIMGITSLAADRSAVQ